MANIFKKINDFVFGPEEDEEFVPVEEPAEKEAHSDFSFSTGKKSKVVKINTTAQLNVVIVAPTSYDGESKEIADHLKTKRTVVVNMEGMNKEDSRRMLDFLLGAVYACDGNIQKISAGIFLIAPYNVGIMGDIRDELKNNGIFSY